MSFDIDIGCAAERGPREQMEDCVGAVLGEHTPDLLAVIADGVSSSGRGREAAQTSVRVLLEDFHSAPPTWETSVVLDRLIGAQNSWLCDHNRRRQNMRGAEGAATGMALTTLTALALRGHGYTVAHVGDTRAWLVRAGSCMPLTTDHHLDHPDLRNGLTRALGLDERVLVEYVQGELLLGDVLVLTSDGVHGRLKPKQILSCVAEGEAVVCARALVRMALDAGTQDNASAAVLRVRGLASGMLEDSLRHARLLPVPARLRDGEQLDGYWVQACVADTTVHRVYRVREASSGQLWALKTLHESRAHDPQERAMLAHEAWLSAYISSRAPLHFIHSVEPPAASAFYMLSHWQPGQTLQEMLDAKQSFTVPAIVEACTVLTKAIGRLHQLGVVHRDIKPANLHLGQDGQWRVLDLGVALSGNAPAALRELHAGTPSYMNPEQWSDDPQLAQAQAQAGSDLYAMGVTLYHWLTGKLPYGELEPYQSARLRRDPIPPSRVRPDVPIWLDHIVMRALSLDAKQRFETAEEMVLALERGASRPLHAPTSRPLLARDPSAVWKLALAVSVLFNALLVYWLLFLPR